MLKTVSARELAFLVKQLLINPQEMGEDMTTETYSRFMTQIAETVCDHCGGEICIAAAPNAGDMDAWFVQIKDNDSLPEHGGIWRTVGSTPDAGPTPSVEERIKSLAVFGEVNAEEGEYFPGATRAEVGQVMMQDLIGEYDVPDCIPEWEWVEKHASYAHVANGKRDGIWEFVVNIDMTGHLTDVPEKLKPVFKEANSKSIAYLIFHQGT